MDQMKDNVSSFGKAFSDTVPVAHLSLLNLGTIDPTFSLVHTINVNVVR